MPFDSYTPLLGKKYAKNAQRFALRIFGRTCLQKIKTGSGLITQLYRVG